MSPVLPHALPASFLGVLQPRRLLHGALWLSGPEQPAAPHCLTFSHTVGPWKGEAVGRSELPSRLSCQIKHSVRAKKHFTWLLLHRTSVLFSIETFPSFGKRVRHRSCSQGSPVPAHMLPGTRRFQKAATSRSAQGPCSLMEILGKNVFSCHGGTELLQEVSFVPLSEAPPFCDAPAVGHQPGRVLPGRHEMNQIPLQQKLLKVHENVCGHNLRLLCRQPLLMCNFW